MAHDSKSKASPYKGTLTAESASIGIATAKANAKRLLDDAEALIVKERYPSACALACLSIEEISKPAIIRKILLANSPEQVSMGWKLFSSHHDKAAPWIVPHIIHSNPETYEQFVDAFMHQRDPVLLDSLKQLSIYCGCYGNCHWADPRKVIEQDQADVVLNSARILILSGQASPVDSPGGLRLWQSHMQGCFSVGYVTANNKIVEFFYRAADTGLLPKRKIPPEVAFDFMTTALVLSDGEAAEQMRALGIPDPERTPNNRLHGTAHKPRRP
jgi:AbiV family abortive infection protein